MSENSASFAGDRPYLDFSADSVPLVTAKALPMSAPPKVPMRSVDHEDALRCVAQAYATSTEALIGRDRHKNIAEARCVAYWVLRTQTRLSFPEIGRALGKDHTSAMNGVKRCIAKREGDVRFARFTDELVAAVKSRMGVANGA